MRYLIMLHSFTLASFAPFARARFPSVENVSRQGRIPKYSKILKGVESHPIAEWDLAEIQPFQGWQSGGGYPG
jgi:hypothetical protein